MAFFPVKSMCVLIITSDEHLACAIVGFDI